MNLEEIFQSAKALLSPSFLEVHQKIFAPEHLQKIIATLLKGLREGVEQTQPPPYFSKEITPPFQETFAPFAYPLHQWRAHPQKPSLADLFAQAILKARCKGLLLLLGQRLTSASLTDHRAIPPVKQSLLASATEEHSQGLTVVGRGWTKHAVRSEEAFWGVPKGNPETKNQMALEIVQTIIEGVTWWNVFGHFQHETVYEARIKTGHGARWTGDGSEFIGFLEPFDSKKKI